MVSQQRSASKGTPAIHSERNSIAAINSGVISNPGSTVSERSGERQEEDRYRETDVHNPVRALSETGRTEFTQPPAYTDG